MAKKKGRKVSSSKSGGGGGGAVEIPKAGGDEDVVAPTDLTDQGGDDVDVDVDPTAAAAVEASRWVLARVLDPTSDEEKAPACRADGCDKTAAKIWTKGAEPDDGEEWPLCEARGAKAGEDDPAAPAVDDVGGGSTPPEAPVVDDRGDTTPAPVDEEAKEGVPSKATAKPQENVDEDDAADASKSDSTIPKPEATAGPTEEANEEHGDDKKAVEALDGTATDETWELRRILSIKDITEGMTKCSHPKCKTPAACVYVSNLAPGDDWFSCLDCQDAEFGGFPPAEELPLTSMTEDHLQTVAKHCSRKKNPTLPVFGDESSLPSSSSKSSGKASNKPDLALITPTAPPDSGDDEDDDDVADEEEVWDLTRIFSVDDIKDCPIKCSSESCALPAACVWVSHQAPTTKWYSCLDCQAQDFGGWPSLEELPVSHLAKDHVDFLARTCSRSKGIEMPRFAAAASPGCGGGANVHGATTHSLVTPLPGGLTQEDDDDDDDADKSSLTKTPPAPAKPPQPSKQALAMHQKWQEAAVALGGKDARIVVSKPKANELIFAMLENSYRPMNITGIHKELKAIVPAPVLKACLDEMVDGTGDDPPTFDDSDDEDDGKGAAKAAKKSKKAGESGIPTNDPFKASLCFKAGKSSNASLYYVDYTKLKNNGNGLDPHDRNELAAALAMAQAEEAALRSGLKQLNDEATQLLSEPTNVEVVSRLESEEAALQALTEKVEAGRMHKVNEKRKVKVKKAIESMAAQWRKRRRICMDFLITMEESTDGSVSMKKCLSGDGPIDVDSDEAVAKAAVAFAAKKRSASALPSKRKGPAAKKLKAAPGRASDGPLASEDFVAVALNSQGLVSRIMINEETK